MADCNCGCATVTTVTNADEACQCGCECCTPVHLAPEEEIRQLEELRQSADQRLAELKSQ